MSKSVMLTCDLPTTRKEGGPLALSEIKNTAIDISLDGGSSYVPVTEIVPTEAQSLAAGDFSYGTYYFRFVVTDIADLVGDPYDFQVDVTDDSAPGQVANVQVTWS